jgi:small subunit ribosomal protein S8
MSLQDPISDMLVRIKNAQAVTKKHVVFPASKLKSSILEVLKEEGYIDSFETNHEIKAETKVLLKYYDGSPVIEEIRRVSRPGLRIYKGATELPLVKGGLGVAIVSTCKGVMTARNAQSKNLGGELLCIVA